MASINQGVIAPENKESPKKVEAKSKTRFQPRRACVTKHLEHVDTLEKEKAAKKAEASQTPPVSYGCVHTFLATLSKTPSPILCPTHERWTTYKYHDISESYSIILYNCGWRLAATRRTLLDDGQYGPEEYYWRNRTLYGDH